jgi:hypothetical protein
MSVSAAVALPVLDNGGLGIAIAIWGFIVAVGFFLTAWLVKAPTRNKVEIAVGIAVLALVPFVLTIPVKTPYGLKCGSALQPQTPAPPRHSRATNPIDESLSYVGYDADKCSSQRADITHYAGFFFVGSIIVLAIAFYQAGRAKQ